MKTGGLIMASLSAFFIIVAPVYWFMSEDPTGTTALVLTLCLTLFITLYLLLVARRTGQGPEDNEDAEVSEGAGELGFFSPYSWWPLWSALTFAVIGLGVVLGWWLAIIGAGFLVVAVLGWVFEYYRGAHAH